MNYRWQWCYSKCRAGETLSCRDGLGDWGALGLLGGAIAAMVIDGAAIARPLRAPSWTPVVQPARTGATVGFAARF